MVFDELRRRIGGQVLVEDDEGYLPAAATKERQGRPAVVVRPADAADVATAVRYATEHGLDLAVKSGGHDFAGRSTNDGGLLIDLGGIRAIEVLGDGLVRIGSGAVWGDVAAELARHSLALTSGDTRSVGVGGLTLSGGVGWMVRLWGLALDSLVEAEVVTADGRVVTASEREHPDLFWGLRGGGGNFGVVTRFTFRAHPLDGIWVAEVRFDPQRLAEVLRGYRDAMRVAPEALNASIMCVPPMDPSAPPGDLVWAVWAGSDEAAARAAFAPLLELPGALSADVTAMAYADVLIDEPGPPPDMPPMAVVSHNGFAREFSDDIIDDVAVVHREIGGVLMIRSLGGAYGRVPADATAWAWRDAEALVVAAAFGPLEQSAAMTARIDGLWARLGGRLQGMYGNFTSHPDPVPAMFPPATLERLREIKRAWDPANVFRGNLNIQP